MYDNAIDLMFNYTDKNNSELLVEDSEEDITDEEEIAEEDADNLNPNRNRKFKNCVIGGIICVFIVGVIMSYSIYKVLFMPEKDANSIEVATQVALSYASDDNRSGAWISDIADSDKSTLSKCWKEFISSRELDSKYFNLSKLIASCDTSAEDSNWGDPPSDSDEVPVEPEAVVNEQPTNLSDVVEDVISQDDVINTDKTKTSIGGIEVVDTPQPSDIVTEIDVQAAPLQMHADSNFIISKNGNLYIAKEDLVFGEYGATVWYSGNSYLIPKSLVSKSLTERRASGEFDNLILTRTSLDDYSSTYVVSNKYDDKLFKIIVEHPDGKITSFKVI